MVDNRKFTFVFFLVLFLSSFSLFSMHNSNRYFPFLEKPQIIKRGKFGTFYPSFFYISDPNAFGDNWATIGINELYGKYDLEDVINSLQSVTEDIDGETFINPFITEGGVAGVKFVDKSIKYNIGGSVKSFGFALKYEQNLPWKNFFCGAFLPIMHVTSNQTFNINESASNLGFSLTNADKALIDRVRRSVSSSMGFNSQDFIKTGIGDLDLYVRARMEWEYLHLMRSINIGLKTGVILPIGVKKDPNNPASVPFMGNGHTGLYIDVQPEFELKQDWRLGFMIGLLGQFKSKENSRMPVGDEPLIFSALSGPMDVSPGITFKFSPYFSLGNLTDGLSLQLRYTYLRHDKNDFTDMRSESSKIALASNLTTQEDLTKWRLNLLSFQLTYDSVDAMKKWPLKPIIYAIYDFPFDWIGGKNAAKVNQFTFGVELNF